MTETGGFLHFCSKKKRFFVKPPFAKNGKQKYMKYFNSTTVAEYIINNTFDIKYKKDKYLWSDK